MTVTVTGSLGNISRILIEKLVSSGREVKVVSSNAERAKEIEQLNAVPLIGSVEDYEFIKKAFGGSEAVYLMIPPNFITPDIKQNIKTTGEQYAKAIKENGIEYVVNLSGIGTEIPTTLGPLGAGYYVEQQLNALENIHVLHLRPGMFMSNFYGAIGTIKHQNMLGNNFDGTLNLPLTHPKDIADAAFKALNNKSSFARKQIQYVVSDVKNGFEVAKILGDAVGKTDVKWVEFSDEQLLNALLQNGFSEQMAKVYMVEVGMLLRDGSIMEVYHQHKAETIGSITLQEFSKEFAVVYQYSN